MLNTHIIFRCNPTLQGTMSLLRFLEPAHNGGLAVGGALEHGGKDPANPDLLGLLKPALRALLHHAHKLPGKKKER